MHGGLCTVVYSTDPTQATCAVRRFCKTFGAHSAASEKTITAQIKNPLIYALKSLDRATGIDYLSDVWNLRCGMQYTM